MHKTVESPQLRNAELPSDGTIKCVGCIGRIPSGESYYIVNRAATTFPKYLRGGNLCKGCSTTEWKQPIDAQSTLCSYEEYSNITEKFTNDITSYADSLANRCNIRTSQENTEIYLDALFRRTQNIVKFFDNTVGEYSAAGAHHDAAIYAEDAVIRTHGIMVILKDALDGLSKANETEALWQDHRIMHRLASYTSNLAISAFRLQMVAAAENYSVSGAAKLGNIMLLAAADSFEKLLKDRYARVLAAEENVDALHMMVHNMRNVPGGLNSISTIVLKNTTKLASRILFRLDSVDHDNIETAPYLKMASVFEILGVRNMEMQCYTIATSRHLNRGTRRLMLAEESMKGKPGSSMWGEDPVPPNKHNALIYAMRAKEYILDAKEIWDEKLRDVAVQVSSSATIDFESLLAKCENIADAATENYTLHILRPDED